MAVKSNYIYVKVGKYISCGGTLDTGREIFNGYYEKSRGEAVFVCGKHDGKPVGTYCFTEANGHCFKYDNGRGIAIMSLEYHFVKVKQTIYYE